MSINSGVSRYGGWSVDPMSVAYRYHDSIGMDTT
jgi:hypothetical protein